ncbi:MAG: methyltransferase domain-containing protein [Patescibacteria group bacterium]|jgi:tRNA G10  N-methylase Trm11
MSPQPANNKIWFLLGREPLLSAAELFSLLKINSDSSFEFSPPFLFYQGEINKDFINRLGGTIKTGVELGENLSGQELFDAMKNELEVIDGKITFGISLYGKNTTPKQVETWGKNLKKELKAGGHSVRYVFNNEATLSSVTVEKNKLAEGGREFMILQYKDKYSIAITSAVQPFESFGARDFGRPGRDSESGMLPPKLALMLSNLAQIKPSEVLLDPFCGSGTIISEALLQGHTNIIGTDLSEKAITDSKTNIEWLTNKNPEISKATVQIYFQDVKNISSKIKPDSIDAIVTEPYLGKPLRGNESEMEIKTQAGELLSLYSAAFEQFKKILRPGGRVVFVIPEFFTKVQPVVISDKLIPIVQKFGFTVEPLLPKEVSLSPFVLYRRSDQLVGREIWKFKLK